MFLHFSMHPQGLPPWKRRGGEVCRGTGEQRSTALSFCVSHLYSCTDTEVLSDINIYIYTLSCAYRRKDGVVRFGVNVRDKCMLRGLPETALSLFFFFLMQFRRRKLHAEKIGKSRGEHLG